MLPNILPETIRLSDFDPLSAGQSHDMSGKIPLSALIRLEDLILNPTDELSVELKMGKDDEGYRYIKGLLKANIKVPCQRCLEKFELSIQPSFCLSPIVDEKATVPSQYEPLMVTGERIDILDMISEEILLGMPMIASHPEEACPGTAWLKENKKQVHEETHPFKILKKQLDK